MRFTAVNDFSINRWSSRWLQSHATDRAFSRRVTFDPFTHGTKEITLDLRGINARFSLAMAARWNRDELRLARIPNLGQAWIILRLHLRSFRKLGQLPFTTLQLMTCMRRSKFLTSPRKRGTPVVEATSDSSDSVSRPEQRNQLFRGFGPDKGATQRHFSNEVFQTYFSRHCFLNNGLGGQMIIRV